MKQKIQLTSMLVLFYASSFAQVNIVQQRVAGGSQSDVLAASFRTKDGGLVVGGTSNSGVSGEKTSASKGGNDYWVIKYDVAGNISWDKTIGGDKSDFLAAMDQTTDGGFILGGTSISGVSGDKSEAVKDNAGLNPGGDFWVVKLDKDGNKIWDKTYGGNLTDSLTSVRQTSDGGYIIGGYSTTSANGDKSETTRGLQDYWVIKISSTGVIEWEKTYGGTKVDRLASVRSTLDGGYIVGGTSESGIGGEKSEIGYGKSDYWIIKLNSTGGVEWDRSLGGNQVELCVTAQQTTDGGYFVAGSSNSTISGLKTQRNRGTSNTTFDYWIIRLDASLNVEMDRTFGGNQDDILASAFQTIGKGFVLGGYSNSGISGEKSEASYGGFDFWMVKEYGGDSSRIYKDKAMGGSDNDYGTSISPINIGEYWFSGYSSSGISGTKTEASRGKSDYWMTYLKDSTTVLPVSFTNLKAYQQGSGVKVLWTSLSEINVAKYDIQRSADASSFKSAGTINPVSNAAKQVDYNFFDQHPVNGSNYYRIKATDLDGKETYTSTALVIIRGKSAIIVYPNPVKDVLNVQVTGKVTLSLINQSGQVVLSKTIENTASINVAHLPSGVYYLKNNVTGDKTQVVIGR